MAQKASVFRVKLNVADLDRHVYEDFALTIARHPSETDARMMLRLLAFALHANEALEFGRGISTDDEPDLWQKDLTGVIETWIDLGTPEPDQIRKACGRANAMMLYAYGDRAVPVWWEKHGAALSKYPRLSVFQVSDPDCAALAGLVTATMDVQCTVSDGEALVSIGNQSVAVTPVRLK